jgi:hypothetical protein
MDNEPYRALEKSLSESHHEIYDVLAFVDNLTKLVNGSCSLISDNTRLIESLDEFNDVLISDALEIFKEKVGALKWE